MSGNYGKLLILDADFLIVGGGVIGLAGAFELAQSGARVVVLERGVCGRESSWAGGGILSPLLPWDYSPAVTNLTRLGCEIYPAWVRQVAEISGIDPEYRRCGMLVLPDFDEPKAAAWSHAQQVRIDPAQSRDVQPKLGADTPALWLPDVAQVRNPRLMKALRVALERMGVTFKEQAEVIGLAIDAGHIAEIRTASASYRADRYVMAAGAWSRQLLGGLGEKVEIGPIRGQMLLFKAAPGELQEIVLRNGIYLIPRADGHILVGSTLEDVGFDKATTEQAATALHAQAVDILPLLADAAVERHWAGLRPASPGNIPIIARHPQVENLYLNGGHFRYGVTMAPASARILANLVFHRSQPFDISPYEWPK